MAKKNTDASSPDKQGKPVFIFHGDKGGVGKSWTCSVFTDWACKMNIDIALVDGDTRNPDVSRMFASSVPVLPANLRSHEGWMDMTDFLIEHQDRPVVVSLPAGIGGDFRKEAEHFTSMLAMFGRPLVMFWVINRLPDSINLLNEALAAIGESLSAKVVVRNLFFGEANKFTRWENSETQRKFTQSGGLTINLTELQERTVDKLFADNANILPFSMSVVPVDRSSESPHSLTPSENIELMHWLADNHKTFEGLRANIGL